MSNRKQSRAIVAATAVVAVGLTGCADPQEKQAEATVTQPGGGAATAQVVRYDTTPGQAGRVKGTYDAKLAGQVPAAIRRDGALAIGNSAAAGGTPPLSFLATDNKTPAGVDVDIAFLIADTLGLEPRIGTTSFENTFVGVDSGRYELAIANIGVSEKRKRKYDFATYRLGLHAFEVPKTSTLQVRSAKDVSGKRVAVSSGTLQEDILLRWNDENRKAGRAPIKIVYYQNTADYYLALSSGRIDAFLGPNPTATYHVATSGTTRIAGTVSSSYPVQGKVGTLSKKGNGLTPVVRAALDKAIANGSYAKILQRWGLAGESVKKSEVNPPGLPDRPAS